MNDPTTREPAAAPGWSRRKPLTIRVREVAPPPDHAARSERAHYIYSGYEGSGVAVCQRFLVRRDELEGLVLGEMHSAGRR